MRSLPSGEPSSRSFGLLRTFTYLVAFAALVSVGCSGDADDDLFEDGGSGASQGAGASGGTKGGRGGSSSGGSSSGGSDGGSSGGSGLAGSGGDEACNLADLESCPSAGDLCCPGPSGGECIPSSLEACGACHASCSPQTADACVERACVCGSEPPCSGDTPFCHEGQCAECRNDTDCAGSPDGGECVTGLCSACDPEDDSGCSGATPICSADRDCTGCSEENPCAGSLNCDEDSGRCVGCLDHADCSSPSAPFCGENGECEPCSSDADCGEVDSDEGQCLSSGKCSPCDPDNDDGCIGEACVTDGDGGYHCAECAEHSDCNDPEQPLCSAAQTCVPCNDASIELPDLGCVEDNGSNPAVCITSTDKAGQCAACDPATNAGCTSNLPFCDSDYQCKGCLDHDDCPSGEVCFPDQQCDSCSSDADCAGNPAGSECVLGSCRKCDPAGNAGCSGEKDTCHHTFFVCVECMSGSHCPPGEGCSNFECTECSSDGECAGNVGGTQCVQITPGNFECSACDPLDDAGCNSPAAPQCDADTLSCVP